MTPKFLLVQIDVIPLKIVERYQTKEKGVIDRQRPGVIPSVKCS